MRRNEERFVPPPEEPEEEFDDTLVVIDKYHCDLNIKLHKGRLTAVPLTLEGFAYLWAGVRATYGVTTGKICYECKLAEEHSVRHLPSSETHPHLVRVGWSVPNTPLNVGESRFSYGLCGTGRVVTNQTSKEFGEKFKGGDVIGCYLDLSADTMNIHYTKNGVLLGEAFTEEKSRLGENPLFPHVSCKNTTIEFNFGEKEEPYFPHPQELEDYVFISKVGLEDRVRGTTGPMKRKECEVLMLCGLPGSGKTFYANQQLVDKPEMGFNILGTKSVVDRMKVTGIEQKYTTDILMSHASNCLNRMFQMAARKNRNYILDQTNVFASAQRRKLRSFEGFHRRAIVIVPSEEEFKSRLDKRTKDEGKEIPNIAIFEMKANFSLPEAGQDGFEEVVFPELGKDEAVKLIDKYREDARKKGPPPEKRFRGKGGFDGRGRGGWGEPRGMMRAPFRGGMNRGFGGGGFNRGFGGGGGRGGFNRNSGGGNWHGNRGRRDHGGNRGGYGGNRNQGFRNNMGGG
ncbi:heterogeneous nuclear ribonucleoprotein U-like protein 1 isoform X2 [Ciona intestinalis]